MRKFFRIIGVVLLSVSFLCLGYAGHQLYEYYRGEDEYVSLADEMTDTPSTPSPDTSFTVDWGKLLNENPDTIGWIRTASGANYPVVQGKTSQEYLHKGFNGGYNVNGCIFMDSDNDRAWNDNNTIIYGHNMKNGTMFGTNKKYREKSFYKDNPYFYIYRPDGNCYVYHISSVINCKENSFVYTTAFTGDEDYQNYLNRSQKTSIYNTDYNSVSDKKTVTLSTCSGRSGSGNRLVIQGQLERVVKGETR